MGGYEYEYRYEDHLGNLRALYRDSAGVAVLSQVEQLGPWGEVLGGIGYNRANKDRYGFGGHERQEDFGLGVYDFGARMYDPVVPRFWQIDPLGETSRRWSPYVYGYQNPVRFTDPDGMAASDEPPGFIQRLINWWGSFLNGGPFGNGDAETVARQSNENSQDQAAFNQVAGAVERTDQAQDIIFAPIPGASALKSYSKGNYAQAGVSASIDILGGALVKGAGGLISKFSKVGGAVESVDDILRWEIKASESEAEGIGNYMKKIQDGGVESIQPLDVIEFGGKTLLVDGHHRLAAAKQLGLTEIPVRYMNSQQFKATATRMGRFSTPEALFSITQRVENQVDIAPIIR